MPVSNWIMGGLFFFFLCTLFTTRLVLTNGQALGKPGCPTKCGDVDIPYPFGLSPHCSMHGFLLDCQLVNGALKALVPNNTEITNILLSVGRVRMQNRIARRCYNATSTFSEFFYFNWASTPYRFSDVYNKFTTIGCEILAYLDVSNGTYSYHRECASTCPDTSSVSNGSCSGMGCCQTVIPKNIRNYNVRFEGTHFNNMLSTCSYAVLLESELFEFNTQYITTTDLFYQNNGQVAVMMDWAIGNTTCEQARTKPAYGCVSSNSECFDSQNGPGYFCNCTSGYEGNPYLPHGCRDIDECAEEKPKCPHRYCKNLLGSYACLCPRGTHLSLSLPHGNGVCVPDQKLGLWVKLVIGLAICVCVVPSLALAVYKLNKMLTDRRIKETRQKNAKRHHDILFTKHRDIIGKMTIFILEELEKATNKFDEALVIGIGGHGKVYKGILSDKRVVAIKKPTKINTREIEEFLNEAVILSQLNHRNVVRFFGCCLESEAPLLVYEFISNGTLTDHLHTQESCLLSWYDRLRIALETAGVLAYLHSAASVSVFHRDIKTSNILLNDGLMTKLSDFGASRSVPISTNEADSTVVQGTFGYLDPEYYETGRLTAKSDVYSFGVILAELLTTKKPIFVGGGSLAVYFRETMRDCRLQEIVDPQIVDGEDITKLESVAALAMMCLRLKGVERPAMKDVQSRLEMLWSSKIRSARRWNAQQTEQQMPQIESQGSEDRSRVYSLEVELFSSASIPR